MKIGNFGRLDPTLKAKDITGLEHGSSAEEPIWKEFWGNLDKLSSGEKQLLIILLTVLLEDGQEYIMMMDEPEISLHISWQYELLNWILELNPNVQLVLTTHSPSIFSDGWGEKAIYMEDITTRKK